MDPSCAVFVFEDSVNLDVFPSLASAESGTEVHDLQTLVYFATDGTVLAATAEGYTVRLAPTSDRRADELRDRLRVYLQRSSVALDPCLAGDPVETAQMLMERENNFIAPRPSRWARMRKKQGSR